MAKKSIWYGWEKPSIEGVGLRVLTKEEILKKELKELTEYIYQEFEDIKEEIRGLITEISEIKEQLC